MWSLFLGLPAAGVAQAEEGGRRIVLFPTVAVGFSGDRYEQRTIFGDVVGLGPTDGLVLGGGVEVALTGRTSVTARAGYSPVNYKTKVSVGQSTGGAVSGKLNITRLSVGVQHRLRARVPVFFAGGLALARIQPTQNPFFPGEPPHWEKGAFLGIGYDLAGTRNRVRILSRVTVAAPGVETAADEVWQPRSAFRDFMIGLEFLLPIAGG